MAIHVHENLGARLPHGEMLQRIWEEERVRPEPITILTEFDFLPEPWALRQRDQIGLPIKAAEYVTRSPYGRRLVRHGVPGAWFVRVEKNRLDGRELDFRAGGPGNDPGGRLPPDHVQLLGAEEGVLSPFGVVVPGRGEHLFFSRHYGDPPTALVAGFVMGEIQRAVDRACDLYEAQLDKLAA